MARHLEAIYEQGVLRPLEPLTLPEHHRVRLTIDEKPAPLSSASAEPANERTAELEWLSTESEPYAGQWVALHGRQLIAHGPKLAAVTAAARAAGFADPFFASVPDRDLPFGGW